MVDGVGKNGEGLADQPALLGRREDWRGGSVRLHWGPAQTKWYGGSRPGDTHMEPVSSDSTEHSGRLTPFERIYEVCGRDENEAAKCFGLIVWKVFENRSETWASAHGMKDGKAIRSRTYFRVSGP